MNKEATRTVSNFLDSHIVKFYKNSLSRKLFKNFQCLGQVNVWEMQAASQLSLRCSCTQTWHTHSNNTDSEIFNFLAISWFGTAWRNYQNITIEYLEYFKEFWNIWISLIFPCSILTVSSSCFKQRQSKLPCLVYWSEYVMFLSFLGKGDLKSSWNVFSIS